MNSIAWRLLKLPNYWRAFGAIEGARLLLGNEFGFSKKADLSLRKLWLSGYGKWIYLRKKRSDRAIFWQCLVMRQYDMRRFPRHSSALVDRYESLLAEREVPLIIDCGGNIGLSAVWFAEVFPHARIVVVEPDEENFSLLLKNVAAYGERITVVQGGVWPRNERLRLGEQGRGTAGGMVVPANGQEASGDVLAYTIDELLEMESAATPLLIKIDIEGSQKELFSENTGWLRQFPCVIMELEDWLFPWKGTSTGFFSCASKLPMDYLIAGENIFCFNHKLVRAEVG